KDFAWFVRHIGPEAVVNQSEEHGLLAVQGPRALATLGPLWTGPDLGAVPAFHVAEGAVAGRRAIAARTGYTGEDGFELLCHADDAHPIWDAAVEAGAVPCGLGARDTLRLEARLCLYGNDIDEQTTPYEAALGWVVKPSAGDFVGRAALER